MSYTVHVSGIAPTTTQAQLHDFFSFCGKISSIDYREKDGKATIYFEKANAAKTAAMLNGGALDGSTLTVTSDVAHQDEEPHATPGPYEQSDKPRAGIMAEYLAKGYKLSDQILERAIDMDSKQGISKRFLSYFHSLDKSVGERALGPEQTVSAKVQSTVDNATTQARAIDEQKGFSKIANDYYTWAYSSPFGQKVKAFYTDTSKQVLDIHEEAKRIANQEKEKAKGSTTQSGASGSAAAAETKPQAPEAEKSKDV